MLKLGKTVVTIENSQSVKQAASQLGVTPSAIWAFLKRHNLKVVKKSTLKVEEI